MLLQVTCEFSIDTPVMSSGHDGEETTTVFHTSVVPEVAEVHVAHTQDGQEFELSHSIEAES